MNDYGKTLWLLRQAAPYRTSRIFTNSADIAAALNAKGYDVRVLKPTFWPPYDTNGEFREEV